MVRRDAARTAVIIAVIGLLLVQPLAGLDPPQLALEESSGEVFEALGAGQNQTIEITNWPNGFSDEFTLEIPAGEALTALNFGLSPTTVSNSDTVKWDQLSDWRHSMAVNDNVDYNQTGLRINSAPAEWGFENVDHGWSLDANGGWARGVDTAGAHTGSQAIYTYSGNYPNQMSTTYWAESPSVDCSSCSGGWELKFWKRLGIESSSWDHAYVQVKGTGGWSTLWQNSGSMADGSYSQSSYRIDSYVAGNSDFRIRFGLGSTDFSVTYDGWNIDDVIVSPIVGSGTGVAKVAGSSDANWTSPIYGTGSGALFQRDPGPYGLLNIQAELPTNTGVVWNVLDAQTNQVIPGYHERTELSFDLGWIDWESHPSIRLKLHIWSAAPESPIIHSISIGELWATELLTDPFSEGWSENGSWNGNQITGTGVVVLPEISSSRPLSGITLDAAISGSGQLELRAGDSGWAPVPNVGQVTFDSIVHTVSLRWNGAGVWTIDEVNLMLDGGNLPLRPTLDIGRDGIIEESLGHTAIGFWGMQDRLSDGSLSRLETLASSSTHITEFWVPMANISNLCLDLHPEATYIDDLEIELTIGQHLVHQYNITQQVPAHRVCLDEAELDATNTMLPAQPPIFTDGPLTFVLGRLKLTGSSQRVWVSALNIPYTPMAIFDLDAADGIVLALNDELSSNMVVNGLVEVSLPLSAEITGAFRVELFGFETLGGMLSSNLSLSNQSTPLTASWRWLELNSSHQTSSGVIDSIQYDIIGSENQLTYLFPITGGPFSAAGNSSLLEFESEPHAVVFNPSSVDTSLRFRLHPNWDDDERLQIKVRSVLSNGDRSIPQMITIGSGTPLGVENDIEIRTWNVVNDLGAAIPLNKPFVKAGSDIVIDVQLAFENMASQISQPKSGDVEVYLLENGFEVGRTSSLQQGRASFLRSIPFGPGNLTYRVGIDPLFSQEDRTSIITERIFTSDSLSPLLIDSNVARFDHRSPSQTQLFSFEIYDRPQLPTNLALMLWAEWLDDIDGDGSPSFEEYSLNYLYNPSNLSASQGIYSFVFDDTAATVGDLVYGYVVGADVAGNELVGGGSEETGDELFIYQVKQDGVPAILGTEIAWGMEGSVWLNPGLTYELVLPFDEPNGISDLSSILLDLTGPLNSLPLQLEWTPLAGECETDSSYLILEVCNIYSRDSAFGPFNPALELRLEFQLAWDTPFSEQHIHEPMFVVTDRQGQTSMLSLPQLRWRYSNDLYITPQSLSLTPESGSAIASDIYLRPDTNILAEGRFVFARTGLQPESEFQLEIGVGFSSETLDLTDGTFSTTLQAPSQAGNYPLVLALQGLPASVADVTSFALPSIIVDDISPSVKQVNSPRVGVSLDRTQASIIVVELQIQETIMMSTDGVSLHWALSESGKSASNPLYEGEILLDLPSNRLSGLLEAGGLIDLSMEFSRIPDDQAGTLHVWIEGTDAAGNPIDSEANSITDPLASWHIDALSDELEITDITYSRTGQISYGESITVVIDIKNRGSAASSTNLTVIAMSSDGESEIARVPVELEMGETLSVRIDWAPRSTGVLWLEIRDDGEYLGEGQSVTVLESNSNPFSSFDAVDSSLLALFAFLIIFTVLILIVILRGDAGDEDEWDGGWEEDSDHEMPVPENLQPPLPPPLPIPSQPSPPPEILAALRDPPR